MIINKTTKAATKPVVTERDGTDVYDVYLSVQCFPLLEYHCKLATDIEEKIGKLKLKSDIKVPALLEKMVFTLTVLTNGDIEEDIALLLGSENKEKFMRKDKRPNHSSQTPIYPLDSSCAILFAHRSSHISAKICTGTAVVCVTESTANVQIFGENPSLVQRIEMDSLCLRRTVTHVLGESIFDYAGKVCKYLQKVDNKEQKELYSLREAVNVLLTRRKDLKANSEPTNDCISEEKAAELNAMKDNGVLAYGLLPSGFTVFVDEDFSNEKERITQRISQIYGERNDFEIKWTPRNFLKTSAKQGEGLKNVKSQEIGTIGMVTDAYHASNVTAEDNLVESFQHINTDRKEREKYQSRSAPFDSQDISLITIDVKHGNITQESMHHETIYLRDKHTSASQSAVKRDHQSECEQKILVAVTAGHFFDENDTAYCIEKETQCKLGKCIASLHKKNDKSTMNFDIAVIEIDDSMENKCSTKFLNEESKCSNCILFSGTLARDSEVFMRGQESGLTKGVIYSPDFRLVDESKGYLVKGFEEKAFTVPGDSGSVVFCTDWDDPERETVQVISLATRCFDEEKAKKLKMAKNVSYTVRMDTCLQELARIKQLNINMPIK